jgi:hypothetical protein
MLRKPLLVLFLLLATAMRISVAQTAERPDSAHDGQRTLSGNWSANSSTGLALAGTWTATPEPKSGGVIGTWTLVDREGKTLAGGGWSAAKSAKKWSGAWRAVVSGRSGEYSGTWTSSVDAHGDVPLVDLFEKAIGSVVSGTWRSSGHSGAWSIRARK